MGKYVFVLVVGLALGYAYGFKDAKQHPDNIVVRLVNRVGGETRERVQTDLDAKTAGIVP